MESAEMFRKIVHMSAIVYLVYYLIQEELFPGFYKWYGVIIIMSCVLIFEGIRLKTGKVLFGLRSYEKKRIAAYAWFAVGMGIALLFFKMEYVVPITIGMALIDPLIGEVKKRKNKLYPLFPAIVYGIIVFICLLLLSKISIIMIILFSLLTTISAISAEYWDIKYIDDDFLMIVVPLLVLSTLDFLLL